MLLWYGPSVSKMSRHVLPPSFLVRSCMSRSARSLAMVGSASASRNLWPTMNSRLRRCGAPKSMALVSNHSTWYSFRIILRTRLKYFGRLVRKPHTFSTQISLGCSDRTVSIANLVRLRRGSSGLRLGSESLLTWHGMPMHTASTISRWLAISSRSDSDSRFFLSTMASGNRSSSCSQECGHTSTRRTIR